jgi:hypothetical protein
MKFVERSLKRAEVDHRGTESTQGAQSFILHAPLCNLRALCAPAVNFEPLTERQD